MHVIGDFWVLVAITVYVDFFIIIFYHCDFVSKLCLVL